MKVRRFLARALAATLPLLVLVGALAVAGPAAAQLQYGDIYGTVTDQDGQALPGVTVTVSGVAAPRVQVTDETGGFRVLNLSPGLYAVTAQLDGYSTVEYPDIAVELGGKKNLQIKLSSAIRETITVTGEAPLLDERQINRGAVVPARDLDSVPTARDPWALLALAPGVQVDRVNVGGNESGQQSGFLGPGAAGTENTFAVDGVILNDMAAVGGSATYFDFGAFEEVQFTTSSADVTVATAGVTINQVTKRGTNEWRAEGRYLRTDGELQSEPKVPNGNKIDSVEEYGANVGGPLMRDHLWIWGAYGESDIRNLAPSPVEGRLSDITQLEDLNAKVNFQLGQATSGVVHYWTNDKQKFGRVFTFIGAPVVESTHDQTTPQDIYKVEATHLFGSSFVLTALWGRDDGIFTLSPKGGLDADVFTDENFVIHGSSFDFFQDAVIDQGRLDGNYFVATGKANHELKFGVGFREQENHSITNWPRGVNTFYLDGELALARFNRNRVLGVKTEYDSVWLQDTLSLDRWTIAAGLRYDKQSGENLASTSPANPRAPDGIIPELQFQGNDAGGFEWETIVPRVSATYAAGEQRNTLARASFSQYAQQLGQGRISAVNPAGGYSYAYYYFTDANGNLVLDPGETPSLYFGYTYGIDETNPDSLVSPSINDPDLDPAITDEITLGLEHQFSNDFAAGVTAIWRETNDVIESFTLVTDPVTGQVRPWTRNDFEFQEFVTGTLPDGSTGSGAVFRLREGIDPTGGSLQTNGDSSHEYLGVSATITKRLANRWSARGHLTWNDWNWNIGSQSLLHDDPTNTTSDGLDDSGGEDIFTDPSTGAKADVFVGSNWSFNVSGLYQVAPDRPWGFNVAASFTGREGYASPPVFRASRGSAGRVLVEMSDSIDEFRNDDLMLIDARIEKEFTMGDLTMLVGIDGFNLLNDDAVLQRDRRLDLGSANVVRERLSPRIFRVGVTLRYR